MARYAGTRLGRQELDGEIIEDRPDALWSRALLERCRVARGAADATHRGRGRSAGLDQASARTPAALSRRGRPRTALFYVIADETVAGVTPALWAAKAIALWRRWRPMRWWRKSIRAATW